MYLLFITSGHNVQKWKGFPMYSASDIIDFNKSLFVFILTAAMQVVFLESETVKQLLGYDFTKSTDRASYR